MSAALEGLIREELNRQADKYILEDSLKAAVTHLLGRGKLYRPRLALVTYEAITGDVPDSFVAAVTPLELIHTFTLIHDDLPCMDNAELRRGVATVHVQYGEATAVMAGDALCDMAFQVLADPESGLLTETALQLVAVLANATQAVVAGQIVDLASEGKSLSVAEVQSLHRRKTGALLSACCDFGALLAGADAGLRKSLQEVGLRLGELFQFRDDLLSALGNEVQVGKSLQTDFVLEKSTVVSALGEEGAQAYAEGKATEVLLAIDNLKLAAPDNLLAVAREAFTRSH